MFSKGRAEIRLGLILGLVAVAFLVVGVMAYDETWGRFLAAVSDTMPFTILILVWASRLLRERSIRPSRSQGLFHDRSAPRLVLIGGLAGLIGAQVALGLDPLDLMGALTGTFFTVMAWVIVDPVGHDRRVSVPRP